MADRRVVIVEPQRLVREALTGLFRTASKADVSGVGALCEIELAVAPDMVILSLPPSSAIPAEALAACRAGHPTTRIVVLADAADAPSVASVAAGVLDAVLSRDMSANMMMQALDLIAMGMPIFPPTAQPQQGAEAPEVVPVMRTASTVAQSRPRGTADVIHLPYSKVPRQRTSLPEPVMSALSALSVREQQILRQLAAGGANKTIAREMQITEATVKVHVKALLRKLGVANRTQAAVWAMSNGVVAATAPDTQAGGVTAHNSFLAAFPLPDAI